MTRDEVLTRALSRLDAQLLHACDVEQHRVTLLAGDGRTGWDGVRNLLRPTVAELAQPGPASAPAPSDEPLVPAGHPVLDRLRTVLDVASLDVLLLLLAPHVDPRYQSVYAVLHDDLDERRVTERVVLLGLGTSPRRRGAVRRALAAGSALARGGLVRRAPGAFAPLGSPLELAPDVVDAVLGDAAPGVDAPRSSHVAGAARVAAVTGTAGTAGPGRGSLTAAPLLVVHGTGDAVAAARSVTPPGAALLVVEVAPAPDAADVCRAAWRAGVLAGLAPLVDLRGWTEHETTPVVAALVGLVDDVGGRLWVASRQPVAVAAPHLEARPPDWSQRRRTWTSTAAALGVALDDATADVLASRHRIDAAAVHDVLADAPVPDLATLSARAAAYVGALPTAARRPVVRRRLDDLVLAPGTRDALDRLVHYVARRDELARAQGLAARHRVEHGPLVLFAGRSGTGKTAAAEGVAAALGRPLFTLDLSQLMSKYIGDTEKNVDEVLRAAEQASGVLFCDEADALFSHRTEGASTAGEHFSNVLVGYLLQRIEAHEGVVVLATNLRHALDDAFVRRFRFRIEFPLPTPDERERIWDVMLPPGVPRAPGLALAGVARRDDLSGGDVANAALRAIFLADRAGAPLTQEVLEQAVALELMEQGRLSRPDRPVLPDGAAAPPDRGLLLRAFVETLQAQLRTVLRATFLKEVHVVHGSPSQDRLAGRRPAVSLTLLRLAAPRGTRGMRAGFVVSVWSAFPEEEYELIGVVHEALSALDLTEVAGRPTRVRLHESSDFDLLHKFWSSHERPVQASVVLDVEIE
ncbi:ATP-binding protein [Cellulomonas sp. KH9]|uniref:AAA family ATPase n=1 Tax=Cellulomonas sp. KH9 TaxID=1855324 RepID=UPI0008E3C684|nr:ATP-binding protein [Cellulomonas sp. KH9]SFK01214.1 ATPase family associated with various cellular activities (AAA) [Cellulomonas sp. KH9]